MPGRAAVHPYPRKLARNPTLRQTRPNPVDSVPTTFAELGAALPDDARLLNADDADIRVDDLTHDSRETGPGVVFACRPGRQVDGHDYAEAAVAAGSPGLLVERPLGLAVPQWHVASVADVLGEVAAHVHGHPSGELRLGGVTGTNGKTTITYLVDAALRAHGDVTGVIGTVETRIAGERLTGVRTTPEATDLQRLLRRMRQAGVTAGVMEVSSHGLALGRVTGTRFDAAVFTNLSQDHLDFHPDLEAYFAAKAQLFTRRFTSLAIINVDDAWGRRLAEQVEPGVEVVRVSASGTVDADVGAHNVRGDATGSTFVADLPTGQASVHLRLAGFFNVTNALCALAAASALGVDPHEAAAGVGELAGVPGRMERVEAGQRFSVLVDYAHTPDSLAHALRAARELSEGRVLVVVGCGGERDVAKRPAMGRVAAELADVAFLTSDNPRSEDPRAILEAVAAGARETGSDAVVEELDRRAAIAAALDTAAPGDVVLIAGKGHERVQELADRTVTFDDAAVARQLLTTTTHTPTRGGRS